MSCLISKRKIRCKHVVARLGHAQRRDGTDDYRCFILEGGRLGSMPEGVGGTASPEDLTTASSRGARCPLSLRGEQTSGHAHGSLTACSPEEPRLILARMTRTPLPGWDKKATERPTAFMMVTKFAGVIVLKLGHDRQLARPLSVVQQHYLTALDVPATCFTRPQANRGLRWQHGASHDGKNRSSNG
jgi:hypothetical protein